jgi:UDP-N-acetylglucosamine--N-acetylmuramyl-(pentapeptide) pyrophosphoryl-undecaprenol N-acetylglucosamine transferase
VGVAELRRRASAPALAVTSHSDSERAQRPLRLALAGGGTGGHVLPGRHLVEHARACGELGDLLWFQTGRAVEDSAMQGFDAGTGFERRTLRLEPAHGGAPGLGRLALLTLPAALAARRALRAHASEVLLGLGGFTSLPAVLAARSLGIPVALLEINAQSGRATQRLARHARRIFHAWPGTLPEGGDARRDLWTGPPLGRAFQAEPGGAASRAQGRAELGFAPEKPLLVVLGGSQGALGLNRFLAAAAPVFAERGVSVLHQTGPGRLAEAAAPSPVYRPVEFLAQVDRALRAATFVLCRGGASTLAEVGAVRVPAWVVPYPHHADRHQERNARQLGAGVRVVQESELDLELARELARLCGPTGAERRAEMRAALEGRVPLDGARRIWQELLLLGRGEP